jgi:hypothetical protein
MAILFSFNEYRKNFLEPDSERLIYLNKTCLVYSAFHISLAALLNRLESLYQELNILKEETI